MGRPPLADLRCPHCQQTSTVQSSELEEARAVADGLRRLLVQSDLAFFEIDASGCLTVWNGRAAEALGVAEVDAVGQPLEELVAAKHRARVSQALVRAQRAGCDARSGSVRLSGRDGTAAAERETTFALAAIFNAAGWVVGAAGLAEPESAGGKKAPERMTLPAPVGGVAAWRCTLDSSAVVPSVFELSQARVAHGEVEVDVHGETFRDLVEKTVRAMAPTSMSVDGKPTPFEADAMPFETQDGTPQYFSIRGVATHGPEMPFGGSISLAQGYVIDTTSLRLAIQESSKWHERWRALAHLSYNFVLLLDITEYRVLSAWEEASVFGEHLEGKSLFDFVTVDDHVATMECFSTALLAPDGTHSQALFFWHRAEKRRIFTECAIIADASDPSVLFVGAKLTSTLPTDARPAGSASSSDAVSAALMLSQGRPKPAAAAGAGAAAAGTGAADAGAGASMGSGTRLTAAALTLASAPPGLRHCGEAQARGRPLALGSPDAPRAPCEEATTKRQSSASRRSEPSHPPKVFPTELVLHNDEGSERWRSDVQPLGEHVRAADLLKPRRLQLFNMPQEMAETVQADTHVLFVVDSDSGEMLQVANITGTSLHSLQRHCGVEGKMTIVIAPVENSEDAFETIPGPSK